MSEEVFTAYDIRGKIREGVSLETAWNIGKAMADWLPSYGAVAVIRGKDANETLIEALIEGLRLQGRDVLDAASGDKNQLMELVKDRKLSGGVYVSHDTQEDIVLIELYGEKSQLIVAENGLSEIAQLVEAGNFVPAATKGELTAIA